MTPESVNFMATYGKGMICAPLTEERARQLELGLMVERNTESMKTAIYRNGRPQKFNYRHISL